MRQVALSLLLRITSAPAVHDQASAASHARGFDSGSVLLELTTAVRVVPGTLPFPAPVSKRHVSVTPPRP